MGAKRVAGTSDWKCKGEFFGGVDLSAGGVSRIGGIFQRKIEQNPGQCGGHGSRVTLNGRKS